MLPVHCQLKIFLLLHYKNILTIALQYLSILLSLENLQGLLLKKIFFFPSPFNLFPKIRKGLFLSLVS